MATWGTFYVVTTSAASAMWLAWRAYRFIRARIERARYPEDQHHDSRASRECQ